MRIPLALVILAALATSVVAQTAGPATASKAAEVAPELTGHGLPLTKCEAYNRVYDQHLRTD